MDAQQLRLNSLIADIEAQEAELKFPSFSNEDALGLGLALVEQARSQGAAVTIDIRRWGQQLFHYAFPGTSADNDQWLIRKARVVERFGRSSLLVGARLALSGLPIEEKYFVSPLEYSAHGGAFPICVEGTGPVGVVAVSGLPQEDDHALVVETLRSWLSRQR
jgi:uncharacterized protein (UPF0303 family)